MKTWIGSQIWAALARRDSRGPKASLKRNLKQMPNGRGAIHTSILNVVLVGALTALFGCQRGATKSLDTPTGPTSATGSLMSSATVTLSGTATGEIALSGATSVLFHAVRGSAQVTPTFTWQFGDGRSKNGQDVEYAYTVPDPSKGAVVVFNVRVVASAPGFADESAVTTIKVRSLSGTWTSGNEQMVITCQLATDPTDASFNRNICRGEIQVAGLHRPVDATPSRDYVVLLRIDGDANDPDPAGRVSQLECQALITSVEISSMSGSSERPCGVTSARSANWSRVGG